MEHQVQNHIQKGNKIFYQINPGQKVNKPEELWKTLKSLSLSPCNVCLKDKTEITLGEAKNCSILKIRASKIRSTLVKHQDVNKVHKK